MSLLCLRVSFHYVPAYLRTRCRQARLGARRGVRGTVVAAAVDRRRCRTALALALPLLPLSACLVTACLVTACLMLRSGVVAVLQLLRRAARAGSFACSRVTGEKAQGNYLVLPEHDAQ